ncbi:hypothetical protein FOA52_003974 [Chlamydomonas sp. UWO 241]|nr:hypothetical protein FOA52_003974 [Chlamydomonas sp. UWO 241]
MATTPPKADSPTDDTKSGAFQRVESAWRSWVKADGSTPFAPAADRYHLYVSYACPFACRTVAVLHMKGLQHTIGISVVHSTWSKTRPDDPNDAHFGWAFADPSDPPKANPNGFGAFSAAGSVPDTVNGVTYVRDLYDLAGDTLGRYTVPILWDKTNKTIVSNESSEIVRMLNSEFNAIAKNPDLDLYPEPLRAAIDAVNEWVFPAINMGVYRCGFAKAQGPYEQAFDELFDALDKCESILEGRPYIAGGVVTEADVRLFMTLVRFDPIYVVYFKTNKKFVREYPRLQEYVRELYHTPGVAPSVNMRHCLDHYFSSHPALNAYAVVPKGGAWWWEDKPIGR